MLDPVQANPHTPPLPPAAAAAVDLQGAQIGEVTNGQVAQSITNHYYHVTLADQAQAQVATGIAILRQFAASQAQRPRITAIFNERLRVTRRQVRNLIFHKTIHDQLHVTP
ncbi:MAG: hypothetical protein AB4911_12185 [Oscillochloridaceae bacterium umkhey_bin13]